MMHEPEKSDFAIVATKPANKAGQPVAEPVERRAGTGRNVNQQSTCRAQNRESVSQALGRVRQPQRYAACRQTLLVGAGCLNWARPDLCGGRSVMAVPTANNLKNRKPSDCGVVCMALIIAEKFDGSIKDIAGEAYKSAERAAIHAIATNAGIKPDEKKQINAHIDKHGLETDDDDMRLALESFDRI